MKKFFITSVVAMVLTACSQNTTNNFSITEMQVGFADETRVQLNEECKTVWNRGDMVSVFNKNDANACWRYRGADMTRNGAIALVSSPSSYTATFADVYGVYPYNADYSINMFGEISLSIPVEQNWKEGSYGVGDNIMVAIGEDDNLSFKNIFGWLKLQITGLDAISKITFRGNNNEPLTGAITYDPYFMEAMFSEDAGKEITLICPEVALETDKVQTFYIAIAPQTFTKGATVEIATSTGEKMTKSTDKKLVIERNAIQPMAIFGFVGEIPDTPDTPIQPTPPNNEIWYTSTSRISINYQKWDVSVLYHDWDPGTGEGVIAFEEDITDIGVNAFDGCSSLTSITIPDSVIEIGEWAFCSCDGLTSITIPDNVKEIGEWAFHGCSGLTGVTIPDSVTSIGEQAFSDCNLNSVIIGKNVRGIGNNAFYSCGGELVISSIKLIEDTIYSNDPMAKWLSGSKFTKLTIGDNIVKIGASAFYNCSTLKSVTIPDSVTNIEYRAFAGCSSLTSVNIPNSVTSIGEQAFSGCDGLISATIGNSVTSIGEQAFASCDGLKNVVIPDSVISIGDFAFNGCGELTSITIPNSVTHLGKSAFNACYSLKNVTIGDGITSFGTGVFAQCSNLSAFYGKGASDDNRCLIIDGILYAYTVGYDARSYTILDNVTAIGTYAFSGCILANITIPDSVISIGDYAFNGSASLTSITIPHSVTSIGEKSFYNCTMLQEVYCMPITPPIGGRQMFDNNYKSRKIYVPKNSGRDYRIADYWSTYSSYIYGYEFN